MRLIDLPALFEGKDTIFDRAPNSDAARNDWREAQFKSILEGCASNHGVAIGGYILSLIKRRNEVRDLIDAYVSGFQKKVRQSHDGDEAQDLARKFGLIYAGGRMGVHFKILPWSRDDVFDAIKKSYDAARALLPDDGANRAEGLAALRVALRSLPKFFENMSVEDFHAAVGNADAGFRQSEDVVSRYVIRVDSFNQIFKTAKQAELVKSWLITKGRLTMAKRKNSTARPKDQLFWPDGERRRSFEILWPKKSKKSRFKGK